MEVIDHTGPLWRWTAENGVSWFFVTVDGEAGDTLSAIALMRRLESGKPKGFGALRVKVRVGDSLWQTSLFPRKEGGWLLPVKAAVRRAEGIGEDDPVECQMEVA